VHLLDGHDGIEQFQFEQTAPGRMLLRLCARQEVVDVVGQAVRSRLQADLGGGINLQVERVAAIPRSRSGKHRFVMGLRME